ncbi:hypothetical protein INR49_002779 [Caranx melampygus]|nr:hypothetical protein INR49_002824 [Caranx melampygus]KAG7235322.1 hypothetical protein INR49_002779 [Caranx melampygus]
MYRDLQGDRPEWKCFIEERLLMYSFVNNKFMPPDDPLGRHGPTLENFLRKFPKTQKKQQCPYGKKCTYGVKCKFLHPERAKQLSRSVADEPRKNAKRPQRRASCNSSPQPGQSLLMVEDMAQKLSLGQESSSVKKDPRPEHVKSSQCSSRRTTSRKERPGQYLSLDHSSGWGGVCEEQLDSGLGSIDSQLREAPRSQIEHQYGASLLSCQTPCVQPHYCPPTSVPCSCCPHGPHCQGPTPALQHHTQHQSLGLYQDCGPYRLSVPAYSEPVSRVHTCQHQMFWSDPYRGHPLAVHSRRGECSQWEPDGGGEERQVVRKKLLAIFSAHLVDMAMDLFPHIMDPQLLVAEILMLQGQNRVQR